MFHLFRRNTIFSKNIEPHCAYCAHCEKDTEYQGICSYRGIVALAGSCRRFKYDALRRVPAKPARIRGRFSDDDFFFEELTDESQQAEAPSVPPEEAPETDPEPAPNADATETEEASES